LYSSREETSKNRILKHRKKKRKGPTGLRKSTEKKKKESYVPDTGKEPEIEIYRVSEERGR